MTEYTVSEVSQQSPDMTDDAFALFKADIKECGQLVPIVLLGNEVVDGRKRLRACRELGIEPQTIQLDGGQSPEAIAGSLNLIRTHYTRGQIDMYAGKLATFPRGTSKAKTTSVNSRMLTEGEAAQALGTTTSQVTRAKRVRRKAHKDVVAAVEQGKITLGAAAKIAKLPKDQQPERLKQAVASARGRSRRQPGRTLPGLRRASRRKSSDEVFDRIVSDMVALMGTLSDIYKTVQLRAGWVRQLRKVRSSLATVIHHLERRHM